MSRSYTILVAALLGVAGLGGIAQVLSGGGGTEPVAVAERSSSVDLLDDQVLDEPGVERSLFVDRDCTLSVRLEVGDEHDEVACLESRLIAVGVLAGTSPDNVFDEATDAAVRVLQARHGIVVDGVIGPQTAAQIGRWVGADILPPDPTTCPATGRAAVVDRFHQRTWLCDSGDITEVMPMTSAVSQPDPGSYEVYAKDLTSSSTLTGGYSEMTHFVAFTYGKYQGARIAFHSVPTYSNGQYVQPLDSVGDAELLGDSSGCIRLVPDDAVLVWNWLDVGDSVVVVT